ncbi:MAG: hypothetical protein WDN46_10420 [Methylocella sp.]
MDDSANPFDQFGYADAAPAPSSAPASSGSGVSVREVPLAANPDSNAKNPDINVNPFDKFGFADDNDGKSGATHLATPLSLATNAAAGTNEAVSGLLGAPVDLTNWVLKKLGVPTAAHPFLGSEWIRDQEPRLAPAPTRSRRTTKLKKSRAG